MRPCGAYPAFPGRGLLLMVGLALLTGCSQTTLAEPRQTIPASVPSVRPGTELAAAKTSFKSGNFGYAARYYDMALRASPGSMEACLGLAASYDWLHRFDLAEKTYGQCRTIGGETFIYHNNIGFSYYLRGEYDKASANLARARELQPGHPVIENNLRILSIASSD